MYKNIFLIILLCIFSIVSLIFINVYISLGFVFFLEIDLTYVLLFVVLPIILTVYLIFILVKGLYKKELSRNYGYFYGVFLLFIVVFYFTIYTNFTNYPYIPESQFETSLQNIEVADKENGLLQLHELTVISIPITDSLKKEIRNHSSMYSCLSTQQYCDEIDVQAEREKYLSFIEINITKIEAMNTELKNILSYEYFKQDQSYERYPSFQGYSSLSRLALFQAIYFIENGQEEKSLDILADTVLLGDKLMIGDTGMIGMIVGTTVQNIGFQNIEYIVSNYDINPSSQSFERLKTLTDTQHDSKNIFGNAIKMEYQGNYFWIDTEMRSSMLFNTKEFGNVLRNGWQRVLNSEPSIYSERTPSVFTREYMYYLVSGRNFSSFSGYLDDIEALNTKKTEIKALLQRENGEEESDTN